MRRLDTALIVDDNRIFRIVAGEMLEELGADVHQAGDGSEALSLLPSLQPDLVIADILMPKMDGLKLMAAIAELPGEQPVLFLATAVYKGRKHRDQVMSEVRVDEMLEKPIDADTMKTALERHFDLSPDAEEDSEADEEIPEDVAAAVDLLEPMNEDEAAAVAAEKAASDSRTKDSRPKTVEPDTSVHDLVDGALSGLGLGSSKRPKKD